MSRKAANKKIDALCLFFLNLEESERIEAIKTLLDYVLPVTSKAPAQPRKSKAPVHAGAYISATTGTTGASQFFTVDIEPDAALPAEIAETKIAAMKENVPYTEISEPDPRKHQGDSMESLMDLTAQEKGPHAVPEAPGGSAKKPFSMAASIKAFEDLKLAMNIALGDVESSVIYYGTLRKRKNAQGEPIEHCNELKTAKETHECYKEMDETYKQALAARDADDKNAFDEHMKQWSGNVKEIPTA